MLLDSNIIIYASQPNNEFLREFIAKAEGDILENNTKEIDKIL